MKKIFILLVVLSSIISCKQDKEISTDVFTKVYTDDNILTQAFSIDNAADTVLKGKSGTRLYISAHTFVDSLGKPVTQKITLELKEALTVSDMVLCNLTTTSGNKPLESGGMVFLNAKAEGHSVRIADKADIKVSIPADSARSGMQVFEGKKDTIGISWENPVPVLNQQIGERREKEKRKLELKLKELRTNVTYSVDGFTDPYAAPQEVSNKVSEIGWSGNGLIITKDSTFKVGKYTVHFYVNKNLQKYQQAIIPEDYDPETDELIGYNTFKEDEKTSYLFSLKKLGWANIDRFFSDPRTKEIELITTVDNQSDFKTIYISMVFKNQKMYLQGYQKKDGTYCFSHGDFEKTMLPVGETVCIFATAYKNDKPYFAMRSFTISEKQTIALALQETTVEQLKQKVSTGI